MLGIRLATFAGGSNASCLSPTVAEPISIDDRIVARVGNVKMTKARAMNVKHIAIRNETRCDQKICNIGAVIILASVIHQEVVRSGLNIRSRKPVVANVRGKDRPSLSPDR